VHAGSGAPQRPVFPGWKAEDENVLRHGGMGPEKLFSLI